MNRRRICRAVSDDTASVYDPDRRLADALNLAAEGDDSMFSEFYDLSSKMVYGIAIKVLRDRAIAEEVIQEIYLELWRLAPRFDESKGSAKDWTAMVTHRRAVDRVRSEESRRRRDEREIKHQAALSDEVADQVVDQLDHLRVKVAMARLSERQREAVSLAYYGENTYREVAVLLEVPEGTVKTRIRDGLIKLRDEFEIGA